MTIKNIFIGMFGLILFAGIVGGIVLAFLPKLALGSAPSGLQGSIATSGPMAVTPTVSLVMSTSTCSARIITTQSSAIRLTLSDINSFQASATQGEWQAASTTATYDSGLFGCGTVRVHSQGNQNIWITEVR